MKKSLSQKVYEKIIEFIITGKYDQNTVINESNLVEELGISRSPIREALVLLCNEGVLYSIPRFGYKLKIADGKYLEEIIRFRLTVEPAYLEYYFDKINNDDIESIKSKIVLMDKERFVDPSGYWRAMSLFHLELAYVYRDQYFYDTLKLILNKQWITFSMLYWNNWGTVIESKLEDNHGEILEEISLGNKAKAIELLRNDINSF